MATNEDEGTAQLFASEPMSLDASAFELLSEVPEDDVESSVVDLPASLHEAVAGTENEGDESGPDEDDYDDDNDNGGEEEAAEAENDGHHPNRPMSPQQLPPSSPVASLDPSNSSELSSLPIVTRTENLATSNRPFPCHVCGKRFTQKAHLIIHKRTHTGEKPYACHICHKRFAQSSHLTVHKRVHTGEKPFFCNFCGMGFCRRPRLESHILQHVVKEGRQLPASMRGQMLASLSMAGLGSNGASTQVDAVLEAEGVGGAGAGD
ncbi:zinc finger protein [Elysia marginata]|uniref:Zinc finger protein n=1 Tax=Elysia marginata TaxID=1093978 RepID=A0AAV4FFP1_9GAST|nr:zinc finger protein [Elysia marginata]